MDTRIRVIEGIYSDPDRIVQIHRRDNDHCTIELIDYFIAPSGRPFMRVEMEQATLVMTLSGACSAVQTKEGCLALVPMGSEMRVTFQADDWPFPAQWHTPREEFNAAVMAML